jgi:hypothetical protein
MSVSDTGSRIGRPRALRVIAAATVAATWMVLTAAPALADAGAPPAQTKSDAGTSTGPGGTLDTWCTAHGGGMSSQSDGTEQCNL